MLKNTGTLFPHKPSATSHQHYNLHSPFPELSFAHPGFKVPSRNSQARIAMIKLAAISPHTMNMYTLRSGKRMAFVCLMAFQTHIVPNPRVKPAAVEASLKSETLFAILMRGIWSGEVDGRRSDE
jgi:hypothetical protein